MTTVLVLDEGFMSGAYTALGLRDAGCHVIVLAGTGGRGRFNGRCITWSLGPDVSSDAFLQECDRIVQSERVDVVYPVTEPAQQILWNAKPTWADRIYPRTDAWQRELLLDKSRMSHHVREAGVSIPASFDVRAESDVADGIRVLGTPVVIKGVSGRGGCTTWIAASHADAVRAVRSAHAAGIACFLQRYIRGATFLVGGLFDDGEPVRVYAGEKLRQHPPRTGPSIEIRSIDDDALLEVALRVFRAARVSGLASVDFIRDDDGREGVAGRYLFLEVNPRPWGSITALAEVGVDVFSPLRATLDGELPEADLRFRPGVSSTVFPLYLRSPEFWRSGRVLRSLVHDLRGAQGRPWREPRQAAHLLNRLYRVGRNWPRH